MGDNLAKQYFQSAVREACGQPRSEKVQRQAGDEEITFSLLVLS